MIVSSSIDRLALALASAIAAVIVYVGFRDGEPLLIVAGPALLIVAALIRSRDPGAPPAHRPVSPSSLGRSEAGVPSTPSSLSSAVREQLIAGDKIGAIRQYREETGVGLKEAKDAVESLEDRMGADQGPS